MHQLSTTGKEWKQLVCKYVQVTRKRLTLEGTNIQKPINMKEPWDVQASTKNGNLTKEPESQAENYILITCILCVIYHTLTNVIHLLKTHGSFGNHITTKDPK